MMRAGDRHRPSPRQRRGQQRGSVAVLVAVTMVVLLGFASLVIDIGNLYRVRGQLQNAADSAALAGAQELDHTQDGIDRARDKAREYAAQHLANGTAVALADDDIVFGHWNEDQDTFTSLGPSPDNPGLVNAVQILDRRDQTQGNPVSHMLAPLLGIQQSDLTALATAIAGGPDAECGFPMVVPDCALHAAIDGGTCDYCMYFQDNNSDNAGWTSFDDGAVSGPAIKDLIEAACYSSGSVAIDPTTGECRGECNKTSAGQQVKVQNGNLMNQGGNNFCPVIQDILTRGVAGGPAQPFTVRVPVLQSTSGTCDASQFSSFKTIAGYATLEIYGAKCAAPDPGVFAPSSPCTPPPSDKYIVAALRCDLESEQGVASGTSFGLEAKRVRLVR
jgi:Flp pilus assembly protein TadG